MRWPIEIKALRISIPSTGSLALLHPDSNTHPYDRAVALHQRL